VASAYADDNFNIFRAEVEIARRTYHKHSLAARVAKMHLLKLEKKLDKAAHDATWFHVQANAVPAIDDPEWVTASAEFRDPQAPNNSGNNLNSSYQCHSLMLIHTRHSVRITRQRVVTSCMLLYLSHYTHF
jgi:hypothetical protein